MEKKTVKTIVLNLALIFTIVFVLIHFHTASIKSIFSEYLEGKYGEPFTIVRVFKEWHSDRGICYRVKAKSDRFDDPFVMFAYPYPNEYSKCVLEVNGKEYEMEDEYPEVIFQNQYLDKLRPLTGELPLMKCRIEFEGSVYTLAEVATGMKSCLRNPMHPAWVTVYLLTDEKESITPEYIQAIQSQMESYNSYSYDLYIGILNPGEMVSEEEYYENYDTSHGLFYDFMRKSTVFDDIIHISGGSSIEGSYEKGIADNLTIMNGYFDENGYWKDIRALDYVDLSEYENLEIPAEEITVTQEETDEMIQLLIRPYGSKNSNTQGGEEEMQYPEFTDAFVQEHFNTQYGWNTVEDAENTFRKIISDNKRYAYVMDWMSREVSVSEIPEDLVEACSYIEVQKDLIYAKTCNMSFEEYMPLAGGDTLEKYWQCLQSRAEKTVRCCRIRFANF